MASIEVSAWVTTVRSALCRTSEALAQEQPHADLGGPVGEPVRERQLVLVHAPQPTGAAAATRPSAAVETDLG